MNGLDTIIKELRGARMDLRGCTESLARAEFMRQQARRWAKQKRSREAKCNCDAYAFPHRIGGGKCIAISGARS